MNKKNTGFLIIAIILVIIGVVFFIFAKSNNDVTVTNEIISEESAINKPEGFVFYDSNGNQMEISNYEGTPMCIIFFSSDAENASNVLTLVDSYYSVYKTTVNFLIINTDEPDPNIIDTIEGCGFSFEVYYDNDNLVSEYYSYSKLPVIIFLQSDGTKYNQFEGIITEDSLIANLDLISGIEY